MYKPVTFLADRTNGRAYATTCRPSVCLSSVCNGCTVAKRYVVGFDVRLPLATTGLLLVQPTVVYTQLKNPILVLQCAIH